MATKKERIMKAFIKAAAASEMLNEGLGTKRAQELTEKAHVESGLDINAIRFAMDNVENYVTEEELKAYLEEHTVKEVIDSVRVLTTIIK